MAAATIPLPPIGGNANNPTGAQGGSSTAYGRPMLPTGLASPQASGASVPGVMPQTSTNAPQNAPISAGSTIDPSELEGIYGAGVGSYLSNLLSNGGMNYGLLNQVNTQEQNAMQGQVNTGQQNLNATLGAEGVSANSSTNALATSNYQQNATAQENSQIAQNYMQEYLTGQQELGSIIPGIMNGAQTYTANQNNWMDYLGFGANLAEGGINAASMLSMAGLI